MHVHATTFDSANGYGKVACSVLRCLDIVGRSYTISSFNPIPECLHKFHAKKDADVVIAEPSSRIPGPVQFTMYESSLLPKDLVAVLNKRKLIIVPCEQNKQIFKASWIRSTVEVCNLGV